MEIARELSINLTVVGITALCVAATALTAWWSAYCQRRFGGR
jgi:hypothetical protein